MDKAPETNKYEGVTVEERQKELKTLMETFTEDEITKNEDLKKLLGKAEPPVADPKPQPKPDPVSTPPKDDSVSESAKLAETLMGEKIEQVEEIYKDAKPITDELNKVDGLTPFQKVTLMSKVIIPYAKMLKKQQETLMSQKQNPEDPEGQTLKNPKDSSGEKYLDTLMSKFSISEKDKETLGLTVKK